MDVGFLRIHAVVKLGDGSEAVKQAHILDSFAVDLNGLAYACVCVCVLLSLSYHRYQCGSSSSGGGGGGH